MQASDEHAQGCDGPNQKNQQGPEYRFHGDQLGRQSDR